MLENCNYNGEIGRIFIFGQAKYVRVGYPLKDLAKCSLDVLALSIGPLPVKRFEQISILPDFPIVITRNGWQNYVYGSLVLKIVLVTVLIYKKQWLKGITKRLLVNLAPYYIAGRVPKIMSRTRSSWIKCLLRDDEAVHLLVQASNGWYLAWYWVSIKWYCNDHQPSEPLCGRYQFHTSKCIFFHLTDTKLGLVRPKSNLGSPPFTCTCCANITIWIIDPAETQLLATARLQIWALAYMQNSTYTLCHRRISGKLQNNAFMISIGKEEKAKTFQQALIAIKGIV